MNYYQSYYYQSLLLRIITPFIISYELIQLITLYLTINTTKLILSIFTNDVFIIDTFLTYNETFVKFVPGCAAASAYYLLLLLTVLTKDIKLKNRLRIFLYGSLIIFLVNIIRIVTLILILNNYSYNLFKTVHNYIWLILGSVLVVGIWIYFTRIYKIRSVPIYSDLKYVLKKIKVYK